MTYPKAIVISAALLAAAIVFSAYQPVDAQFAGNPASRFTIVPLPYAVADVVPGSWVIDTTNGQTFLCLLRAGGGMAVECTQASYPK